jgi:hypothetical protein
MFSVYVLNCLDTHKKIVCSSCAKRGEVISACPECGGSGVRHKTVRRYKVKNNPVEVVNIDRDPKTGIIRYWTGLSDFYYESTYHSLNHFVPEVPYGVHLIHSDRKTAQIEADRINAYLEKQERGLI